MSPHRSIDQLHRELRDGAPGERRRMSGRQRAAVIRLARTPVRLLTTAEIRGVVGHYATNVLVALEARGLLERRSGDTWYVTDDAIALADILRPSAPPGR